MEETELTIEQFRQRIADSQATCVECGWRGHSVIAHLREKHGLTAGQYQKKFPKEKFPESGKLASPIVSELLRRLPRERKVTDQLSQFIQVFSGAGSDRMVATARAQIPPHDVAFEKYGHIPDIDTDFSLNPDLTRALLTAMVLKKNVYISGPTGSGKTALVEQVHAHLRRPLIRVNMNGDVTMGNFVGAMRANPAQGTYFKYGALPNAMRGGYTLLLDEVDYAPPQIAAVMNPVLESGQRLHLEDTDELIEARPGFCIIATGNTGGKGDSTGVYTGTEILNTAFLDRFGMKMTVDYMDRDTEIAVLQKRFPDENTATIRPLVSLAQDIRNAFKKGELSISFSTRKLIDFFQFKKVLGLDAALKATLTDWLDTDDATLVTQLIKRSIPEFGRK